MKKSIAVFLAAVMIALTCSVCMPAFAGDITATTVDLSKTSDYTPIEQVFREILAWFRSVLGSNDLTTALQTNLWVHCYEPGAILPVEAPEGTGYYITTRDGVIISEDTVAPEECGDYCVYCYLDGYYTVEYFTVV